MNFRLKNLPNFLWNFSDFFGGLGHFFFPSIFYDFSKTGAIRSTASKLVDRISRAKPWLLRQNIFKWGIFTLFRHSPSLCLSLLPFTRSWLPNSSPSPFPSLILLHSIFKPPFILQFLQNHKTPKFLLIKILPKIYFKKYCTISFLSFFIAHDEKCHFSKKYHFSKNF